MTIAAVQVAVIPVAGLGTRWLPVTRSVPKELLPVWRDSAVSYAIREALEADIEEIIFIISPGQSQVAEHFLPDSVLLDHLIKRGKEDTLGDLAELWKRVKVHTAIQAEPLGLGHAVLCAREIVNGRPFALLLPDEVLLAKPTPTRMLCEAMLKEQAPNLLLMEVPPNLTYRYGIAALHPQKDGQPLQIHHLVEKPPPEDAPSNLAVIGRYLLTPDIFDLLETQTAGHGGEIQLTDALERLAQERPMQALCFTGTRHDVGNPEGLLIAAVDLALRDADHCTSIRKKLLELLNA